MASWEMSPSFLNVGLVGCSTLSWWTMKKGAGGNEATNPCGKRYVRRVYRLAAMEPATWWVMFLALTTCLKMPSGPLSSPPLVCLGR